MKNFYTHIKREIDKKILKIKFLKFKKDNSLLTSNDLSIQKTIINVIKKHFPRVKQFICEENFKKNKFKNLNFNKPFAVIDPIDGTENFFAENHLYGTLISINDFDNQVDIIYLPALNIFINRDNLSLFKKKSNHNNNLISISSKCLKYNKFKKSNYRVFGSSAYSFYSILAGKLKSFIYCDGAKLWDYYCGIRLAKIAGLKINFYQKKFDLNKPSLKLKFIVEWK